jgi:hydrogenase maturation protease
MELLIGFGNPNFCDDGFGYYVVEKLRGEVPSLHFLAPTSDLITKILGKEKVVFVDATKSGKKPGKITFLKITPETSGLTSSRSHLLSINSILKIGYELFSDKMPSKIYFVGVEAKDVNTFKRKLSKEVEGTLPEVLNLIRSIFKSSNFTPDKVKPVF